MKAYLITTGVLFGLMTSAHVWKSIAEWPQSGINAGYVLIMVLMIGLPGALSYWAWHLLWSRQRD